VLRQPVFGPGKSLQKTAEKTAKRRAVAMAVRRIILFMWGNYLVYLGHKEKAPHPRKIAPPKFVHFDLRDSKMALYDGARNECDALDF
jgi:hypothetical protein